MAIALIHFISECLNWRFMCVLNPSEYTKPAKGKELSVFGGQFVVILEIEYVQLELRLSLILNISQGIYMYKQ